MDKDLQAHFKNVIWDRTVGTGDIDESSPERPDAQSLAALTRAAAVFMGADLSRVLTSEERNFIDDEWRRCVQSVLQP